MKKILITVIASMLAVMGYAQSSMLATLSQNGEISTFYGTQAFVDAYNAAEDGAVITLSSGSFSATDIKKGITIRGAGMGIDANSNTEPTILVGDFYIDVHEATSPRLSIEGIFHNHTIRFSKAMQNVSFIRCRFRNIDMDAGSPKTLEMVNCRVSESIDCTTRSTISCINSIICNPKCYDADHANFEFTNCIVSCPDGNITDDIRSSTFRNCFIVDWSILCPRLDGTNKSIAYNCVSVAEFENDLFSDMPNSTNTSLKGYESIFKTFTGKYTDDETYELTDEAKTKYLGLDGTQVGIYGGAIPYSATPSTPRIVKCDVAPKSSADGKLSIDIEVGDSE